jgi:hypothetical protein
VEGPIGLKDLHLFDPSRSNIWWHEKVREVAASVGAAYPGTDLWSSHMRYVALISYRKRGRDCKIARQQDLMRMSPSGVSWDG